ncbi:flagellar hook-length control protein FliK [Aeoliella mucimassa]|uniref:Flagellar hook-length control protein FliK n=1 Tax=Aeoliella mucimassa TaxID=2527972 RepID=A0A518AKQ6_9BACT|nr:flagellar hook-length control protein FliK [Aeoliella mucimassa]QDU55315.1 Flagellar hook-length control protein FliK [Aeoliella mucimassa]
MSTSAINKLLITPPATSGKAASADLQSATGFAKTLDKALNTAGDARKAEAPERPQVDDEEPVEKDSAAVETETDTPEDQTTPASEDESTPVAESTDKEDTETTTEEDDASDDVLVVSAEASQQLVQEEIVDTGADEQQIVVTDTQDDSGTGDSSTEDSAATTESFSTDLLPEEAGDALPQEGAVTSETTGESESTEDAADPLLTDVIDDSQSATATSEESATTVVAAAEVEEDVEATDTNDTPTNKVDEQTPAKTPETTPVVGEVTAPAETSDTQSSNETTAAPTTNVEATTTTLDTSTTEESTSETQETEAADAKAAEPREKPAPPSTSFQSFLQRSTGAARQGGEAQTQGVDHTQVDPTRFVNRVSKAFQAAESRGGTIQLRLSPPELGAMRIELDLQQGVMTAKLETETAAAKNVLLDNLPALRERLAAQEIRIDKFEVNVQQQSQQGNPDWQAGQESNDRNQQARALRGVQSPLREGAGDTAGATDSLRQSYTNHNGEFNAVA